MTKKLLFILAALACISLAKAQSGTTGTLEWSYSEADSLLTISGAGAMPDYSYGTAPWFAFNLKIKTVVIEPGVESVGAFAFFSIYHLSSIQIPSTVISIGSYSMSSNSNLTDVEIPESVKSISDHAFYHCLNLASINIPLSVTGIGPLAFAYCSKLAAITVDAGNPAYSSLNGVLYNKDKTLLICYPAGKAGREPAIPPTVTTIGGGAFVGCDNLQEITFPPSVTTIESRALETCLNLATINIPASAVNIAEGFISEHCTSIETITVAEGNPSYVVSGGVLFNKTLDLLLAYPPMKKDASYRVPSTVEKIGDFAFAGGSVLTADVIVDNPLMCIYIGEPVRMIGKQAFAYRQNLDTFYIAASVTTLDNRALYAVKAKYMALNWSNPATITYGDDVFSQSTVEALHVPANSESFYRTTPPWSQVPNIIADIISSADAVQPPSVSFKAVVHSGQISLAGLADRALVRIYNLHGILVYARTSDGPSMQIPVSRLPSGAYILQAGNESVKLILGR
jgi:hypothetical protein